MPTPSQGPTLGTTASTFVEAAEVVLPVCCHQRLFICWGGSISKANFSKLEKQIRRAGSVVSGSVVGTRLDFMATLAERTLHYTK